MAQINLLPWREELRKERLRQFISTSLLALVCLALINLFVWLQVGQSINEQKGRNDFLDKRIAELDQKIKEISSLETEKQSLLERMSIIQKLQGSRPEIVRVFDELVRAVPDGMYLTGVKEDATDITLTGNAQSNARVSSFMRQLDESELFENPKLDVIQTAVINNLRVSKFALRVNRAGKEQADPSDINKQADPKVQNSSQRKVATKGE